MNLLLIEVILDRYVAKAQKHQKDWSPAEVEAFVEVGRRNSRPPEVSGRH
jgi:hypothetical protein